MFTNSICCVDHNKGKTEADNQIEVICFEKERVLPTRGYTLTFFTYSYSLYLIQKKVLLLYVDIQDLKLLCVSHRNENFIDPRGNSYIWHGPSYICVITEKPDGCDILCFSVLQWTGCWILVWYFLFHKDVLRWVTELLWFPPPPPVCPVWLQLSSLVCLLAADLQCTSQNKSLWSQRCAKRNYVLKKSTICEAI